MRAVKQTTYLHTAVRSAYSEMQNEIEQAILNATDKFFQRTGIYTSGVDVEILKISGIGTHPTYKIGRVHVTVTL